MNNAQLISTVNAGFDTTEQALEAVRRAYNTAFDPRWQQLQALKLKVACAPIQSSLINAKGFVTQGITVLGIIQAEGDRIIHKFNCLFRTAKAKAAPYVLKAIEGVAIACSYLALGEEFLVDCWQAYASWADVFVESRLEPTFDFEPVEVRLLTTPLAHPPTPPQQVQEAVIALGKVALVDLPSQELEVALQPSKPVKSPTLAQRTKDRCSKIFGYSIKTKGDINSAIINRSNTSFMEAVNLERSGNDFYNAVNLCLDRIEQARAIKQASKTS